MLATRSSAPAARWTSSEPVNSACGPVAVRRVRRRARAPRRSEADAPSPRSTIVRVRSARPRGADGPAEDDQGSDSRTPAGTWTTTPWFQPARVSWASLSSSGQGRRRRRGAAGRAPGSRPTSPPRRVEDDARRPRLVARARSPRPGPRRSTRRAATSGGQRRRGGRRVRTARRPTRQARTADEVGRPEVDVRRVELVRLDRERPVASERRAPVARPASPARRPRRASTKRLVEGEGQLGRGAPRRAGAAGRARRRGRRASAVASVTRATPPSRASRAG